jgi:prevent-host-death family protein
MTKTAEIKEFSGRLAELVARVQAGDEVVLTQENKPVAKIVSATEEKIAPSPTIEIHSLKGHRVLTRVISQSELADEMFASE